MGRFLKSDAPMETLTIPAEFVGKIRKSLSLWLEGEADALSRGAEDAAKATRIIEKIEAIADCLIAVGWTAPEEEREVVIETEASFVLLLLDDSLDYVEKVDARNRDELRFAAWLNEELDHQKALCPEGAKD